MEKAHPSVPEGAVVSQEEPAAGRPVLRRLPSRQHKRMQAAQDARKRKRAAQHEGQLPTRCVCIANDKAHGSDGLPIVKARCRRPQTLLGVRPQRTLRDLLFFCPRHDHLL
jgi:hypothetical protein